MAITFSDSITGQPTSTSAPVIPSLTPEIARDPMDDVHPLLRPSIEEDQKEREALRAWKLETRKKGDQAILNFDSFQPGEKEAVKKRRIIRGVLESEFDINPENIDQYRMARRQAARKIFGNDIGDSDESFFGALQERATKTKEAIDLYGKIDRQATLSALLGGNQIEANFGKAVQNDPAFGREKYQAIQRWKDSKEAVTEQYGDMIPMLRSTFRRMQTGDEWLTEASRVAKELDEDEKTKFLVALRDLATTFPTEEIENGFKRLGLNLKKSGRGVSGAVDAAMVGSGDLVREGGTWHFAELFGSNEAVAEARDQQWRDEQWAKAYRQENDFVADVRRIFEEDYDPIRPLAEEGSKLRAVEEGIYAVPGAVTTTAMAFVPGVGLPMTYGTIREFERQKYRGRLLENGVSRDEAAAISDRLSTISAAPQVLLEKLQANIAVGKLPVLNKIFGKLDDVVASKAVRGLGRFTAASISETGIELTQELTSELVQDLARNFQEEIPDVEWQNGKDGYFDGYFNKTITTFVAVAPLSIIPTMKGLSVEKRAEAVKLTSPLVRKAWGITETDSAAIDAAETPGQQVRAMEQALINRDPQAEGAKEATAELEAQMQKQKEAQKELENMGAIPGVRTSQDQDGFEVYEAETGDTIALVETSHEAAEAVFDAIGMRERASQEHVDALVAKLEAGRIVTDETGVTQEIEDTKLLTAEEAGRMFEGADQRIAREQELLEISEGGSGEVAKAVMGNDIVLGAALPAGVNGRIEAVTKLYGGSSIFTLVHEKAHQVRRTLIERGELGHDEQVSFFRSLNKVLVGRSTKDGQSLEFGGFDADVVDETALDEGWAQFAEIMLLKSQNGKKSRLRELLNKNLSAMVRARVPGASKFASFIRSMRAFFGLNLSRAAALDRADRSGELDSAEMERFRAMVMGETLQDQYESDVVETFEEAFVPNDDVPFSISRAEQFQNRVIAGQDFLEDIKGKSVNPDGSVTVFHGTSNENWKKITEGKKILRGAFFSLFKGGQKDGDSPLDVAKRKFGVQGIVQELRVDARGLESAAAGSEVFAPDELTRGEDGVWANKGDHLSFSIAQLSQEQIDQILPGATYVSPDEVFDEEIEGPVVIGAYHGSTHRIEKFTEDRANPQNDFGSGIYASTSPEDVSENYAGEGPDLTSRIEQRKEQIESEEELEEDQAYAQAKEELVGEGGQIYPLYLPMEKPLVIGGYRETHFDPEEAIDFSLAEDYREEAEEEIREENDLSEDESLDDYEGEVEQRMREMAENDGVLENPLVVAIQSVFERYYGADADQAFQDLDHLIYEGGSFADIEDILRKSEGLIYAEDAETGEAGLSGHIIREVFEEMGFDGIIDRRVNDKFGSGREIGKAMEGMDESTVHIILPIETENRPRSAFDSETSFSLGNSAMADSIIGDVTARVRDPEARADILENIILNVDQLKRDADKLIFGGTVTQKAIVDPRKMKSLRKEAAMRQALRYDELETKALKEEGAVLSMGDAMTLKDMPLHGYIANVGKGLSGGRMESRSAFVKRTGRDAGAEYEGSEGMVGGLLYGGLRSPDQMARELFDEGIIAEESPALMWDLLASERVSVKNNQEDFKKALKRLAEVKKQAKAEAHEWLAERVEEQERDHNPMARLRRSLAMLDAILMALPVELRGKVGGFVQLAKLNSEEKRLEFLKGRIEKLDKVVEDWVKSEHRKQIDKLFDRARPKKTGKGVPKSKIAADFADRAMAIERMSRMTADEVAGRMDDIQDAMAETSDQAETDALTGDLVELMSFGNIDGMNAQALDSFFRNLNSVVETGKMLKDFADEKFKIEADGIKEIVNHDVTGGGGPLTSSQAKRRAKENERLKGLTKFHRQNVSFEWLMNNLSRENKAVGTLQSETHKKLSTMVHQATHSEKRENMAVQTRYQEFLSSVFGGLKGLKLTKEISNFMEEVEQTGVIRIDYAGKGAFSKKTARASNIEAVINGDTDLETLGVNAEEWKSAKARYDEIKTELEAREKKAAEKAKRAVKPVTIKGSRVVEYQSPNVGTPDNLTLSQSQAVNLTMLFRQEGLKDSMIHEGYTEEAMQQMEDFLSPEAKAIRDWLTTEYADNYHTINNVFKEANGVSLPQTEFYSPARRLADGKVDDLSIDSRGGSAMSTNPNFTISRTKNFAEVDQTADALSIYMQHMVQTNHYVAWAQPTKMLRTVFSDKGVKKNINDYAGDSLLGVISERIEWMADGGNRKATHLRWLDNLRAAHTYSSLAFNWGVAIKQLTSLPAYAFDMSFKDFGKYAAKFMANPVRNIKEMASTDYVKTRFKEGYERDVIDGLRKEGGIFMKGLQAGMLFGKAGDIVPVMIGGWMARQRSYDNAIADGMSEAEARKRSTIDFEMITDRAQQAGDMKDFSSFQGGGSIFKLFTMYKTSPRQYYANVYESFLDAKAGKKGASKELGRRLMIGQIILPLTFQFASDVLRSPFNDDDETFEAENYIRAMLLGPLNGLFIAGDFAELITSGLADAKVWEEKLPIADGMTKIAYGFGDFWDGDWFEGLDDVARGIGKSTPNPLTFYDIIRKELKRFGIGE